MPLKLVPQKTIKIPLQHGDRLQITIRGTGNSMYASRVEDIIGGDIVIQWPTSREIHAPLQERDLLCLAFIKEADVYAIDARVSKLLPDPDSRAVVRCEGQIRKIQRRDYVRVPAMIDVRLRPRPVVKAAVVEAGFAPAIKTTTVDISGGGFSIQHGAPLQMGDLYDVEAAIPTLEEPLPLRAKVVRMEPVKSRTKKTCYIIGFDFVLLSEPFRREIVKYVFRFQQNQLINR